MTQPRLLGGRYELEGVVGRGGMAEVYRARDTRLDRVVAIKTLRPDLARDQTFQARFRREAQSAASLNNPSIVAVYDTGEDMSSGIPVPYIVMEYVDGRTVRDLLIEGQRLLPERILDIISGVLRALEYSHQAGIVHRDIKPGNVMVTRNGDVKVMDFGIARAMSDAQATMTQTAQVIGTAQYLSPEQARGERVDARSDLYSTGCLMYELLAGRPPFTGDSPVAIAYQHVRENPIPPSRLDPDVPPWADAIVLKAMAKAPGDRYQSAAEMLADIRRAASGMQVAALAAPPTRAEYFDGGYDGYDGYDGYEDRTRQMSQGGLLTGPPTGGFPGDYQRGYETYGGGGYGPPRKSWARRWLPWLIPLVAIIAIGAVIASMLFSSSKSHFVPAVNGLPLAQAEQQIRANGLSYTVTQQSSSTVAKGTVINTNPANSASVPKGSVVTLTVSSGQATLSMPSLTGETQASAEQRLQSMGVMNVSVQSDPTSTLPQGQVSKTSPASGSTINANTTVTLFVSGGGIAVPSVIGQQFLPSEQQLQNQGFKVTAQAQNAPANQPVNPGVVWSQNPAANTTVPKGGTVTIFYQPANSPGASPSASGSEFGQSPFPGNGQPTSPTSPAPTGTAGQNGVLPNNTTGTGGTAGGGNNGGLGGLFG